MGSKEARVWQECKLHCNLKEKTVKGNSNTIFTILTPLEHSFLYPSLEDVSDLYADISFPYPVNLHNQP